jgi:competence protein ComEC
MGGSSTGRRLAALLLAWLAGVAIHLHEAELLPLPAYVGLALASVAAAGAALVLRRAFMVAVVALALLGFAASGWRASLQLAESLPAQLEGRDLVVTGIVASLPQQGPSGLRFRFRVDPGGPVGVPRTIALGWFSGFHEDAALSAPQRELRAGQRWRFTVRLRQPHGNLNPNGFDYELFLFEQGVRATGYVRDAPPRACSGKAPARRCSAAPARARRDRPSRADRRAAGVLAALAVGDQSAIERDDWDLFRNTGVAHLMSISGLHVTMFAWLCGLLVAAGWRRSAGATLRRAGTGGGALGRAPGRDRLRGLLRLGHPGAADDLDAGHGDAAAERRPALAVAAGALLCAAVVVTALRSVGADPAGVLALLRRGRLLMASAPARADEQRAAIARGWRGWPARVAGSARQGCARSSWRPSAWRRSPSSSSSRCRWSASSPTWSPSRS